MQNLSKAQNISNRNLVSHKLNNSYRAIALEFIMKLICSELKVNYVKNLGILTSKKVL